LRCSAGVTANAHVTNNSKQLSKERTSKYTTKGSVSKNESSVVIACSLAASRLVLDCVCSGVCMEGSILKPKYRHEVKIHQGLISTHRTLKSLGRFFFIIERKAKATFDPIAILLKLK
jgi:hypothetical protein